MKTILLLLALCIAALNTSDASLSSAAVSGRESPTCEANPSLCSGSVRRPLATTETAVTAPGAAPLPCEVYMAESSVHPDQWGVYSGIALRKGGTVGQPEPVIPMIDAKMNEWSPWNALVEPSPPRLRLQSKYLNSIFVPGIQQLVSCSNRYHNVMPVVHDEASTVPLHRFQDPAAGSVATHVSVVVATRDLLAGEELVVPCESLNRFASPLRDESDSGDEDSDFSQDSRRKVLSVEYLSDSDSSNAMCLDQLIVASSSVPGAGRGAFAKRDVAVGQVIMPTPAMHLDWSQMEIVKQSLYSDAEESDVGDETSGKAHQPRLPIQREHGIKYSDKVIGQQLMLNYAYGSPDSHVLLVPTGPCVNFINHNSDRSRVNAYLRWSHRHSSRSMAQLRPMELLSRASSIAYHDRSDGDDSDSNTLLLEVVALRDIRAGDEIFLNYGAEWKRSWEGHAQKLATDRKASRANEPVVSAVQWLATHEANKEPWRTQEEQSNRPYPTNLQTACFVSTRTFDEPHESTNAMEWNSVVGNNHMDCLRPCSITHRIDIDGQVTYNAIVYRMDRYEEPEECGGTNILASGLRVEEIPTKAVTLMDKPYSTDVLQPGVFRHMIGVSDTFFPSTWTHADPNPAGDFIPAPLAPGQMDHFYWKDTGDVALQNAFRLGLSPSIRETLLAYCEEMGITRLLRQVTVEDNGLRPSEETNIDIRGYNWFIQRPEKKWFSNLHWLSPADNRAHEHYLQALSLAGFDNMLKGIGEHLGLDSLVVFHVTFIAVSQSTRGFVHTDVSDTGARTFNVIVPLMKAENGPPELDIQENMDDGRIGRYAYEKDVAALMGDDSWHGTSAVDYRVEKEMRLAATIYIAEVTEENVVSIMNDYTQAYPPRDHELLLSWTGRHWKRDDPRRMLPKPTNDHLLLQRTNRKTT